SWSRTRKSTPPPAAGDSATSRMANLATRRCTKPATLATCPPRIVTSYSPVTHLSLERRPIVRRYVSAELPMKTKNLLVSAVLAIAIGAPIAGFLEDIKGQPMIPAWIPFLHGLPAGQGPGQAPLASLERANEWLNSPPLRAGDLRGK